jgi:hypothetical protein
MDGAEDAADAMGDEDDASELVFVLRLVLKRVASPKVDVKKIVGSIVSQLGQSAFVMIAAVLSFCALVGQQITSRLRSFDGKSQVLEKAKASVEVHGCPPNARPSWVPCCSDVDVPAIVSRCAAPRWPTQVRSAGLETV